MEDTQYILDEVREAIIKKNKKKQSKYRHYPEGGGGFNPCLKVFGALFLMSLIFVAKWQREGGQGPCLIIWSTFEGFVLLNSLK